MLTIQPDGSFSGSFSDSEWEESESGTQAVCECCEFSGQLAQPVRVNDYTYSVGIEHIEYQREPGTDEYADGIHYYFTEPRGLEDTGELLIYLPGAPMAELPEGFLGWVMGSDDTAEEELPFYGLYSEARLAGFRGDPVQEPADDPAAAQTAEQTPSFPSSRIWSSTLPAAREGGARFCTSTVRELLRHVQRQRHGERRERHPVSL